jgi:hypothetical protein
MAIVQLVERGKIKPDGTLGDFYLKQGRREEAINLPEGA